MNLDASAIAPQFQWLWIVVGIAAFGTGGLIGAFKGAARGFLTAGIQGTFLSLVLLGAAPTAQQQELASIEAQQTVEQQFADYAELLDAELIEVYPDLQEADIREPNLGLISVSLQSDHLRILTGAESGKVWYLDSLIREHRLNELEGADGNAEQQEIEG